MTHSYATDNRRCCLAVWPRPHSLASCMRPYPGWLLARCSPTPHLNTHWRTSEALQLLTVAEAASCSAPGHLHHHIAARMTCPKVAAWALPMQAMGMVVRVQAGPALRQVDRSCCSLTSTWGQQRRTGQPKQQEKRRQLPQAPLGNVLSPRRRTLHERACSVCTML